MEYRKKPVVIEAFKYGIEPRPDWFNDKVTSNKIITYVGTDIRDSSQYYCEIKTLEGIMRGNCGDYIIKGVQGEVYPCKPDIFEMTYEIASTSSQTLKENHIVDTNEMVSSQTEISDEEIEKFAEEFANDYAKVGVTENEVSAFFTGMKKYREQLKQR